MIWNISMFVKDEELAEFDGAVISGEVSNGRRPRA
jgi:hypothetical protein